MMFNDENIPPPLAHALKYAALASSPDTAPPGYDVHHARKVTDLAIAMGKLMQLSRPQLEGMRMAGMLHDIGKIYIPADILQKRGCLNPDEKKIIEQHPRVAYDILKAVPYPWPVADIVYQHHERVDGTGYPRQLAGEELLVEARILAVANAAEAMTERRAHRPARGLHRALYEIQNGRHTAYDPQAVDACAYFLEKALSGGGDVH